MIEEKTREIVRQKLSQYLEAKKLRKTPERYAILDKIYATSEHFDVDLLYEMMSESEYRVSRATVYNTIDLLVDAGLVRKHQFGNHPAQYEKSPSPHLHPLRKNKGGKRSQTARSADSKKIRTVHHCLLRTLCLRHLLVMYAGRTEKVAQKKQRKRNKQQ